jgi:hypothetical protein
MPFDLANREKLIALLERKDFLGMTVCGGYVEIDYSEGKLEDRWLSRPSGWPSSNRCAWNFANGEHDWTMKRYVSDRG